MSNEDLASVTKCYVYDKYSKSYFYGLDEWKHSNWGNDKDLAMLMTSEMAVKMLTDLRSRSTDYDLWINVL